MPSEQLVGRVALTTLTIAFVYYTLWTLVTPFFPPASPLLHLFPWTRSTAIALAASGLVVAFAAVAMLAGWVLVLTGHGKQRAHAETRRPRRRRRPVGSSGNRVEKRE
ncbi:hypothetical protein JCM10212_000424 [Sporobolomyces blumeae]